MNITRNILPGFVILFSLTVTAQSNLYISGTQTWNTTNTNWSSSPGGSYNTTWANMSTAYLENVAGTITLNGFEPRLAGLYASKTFTFGSNASEKVYLSGSTAPTVDVASNELLTLNSSLCGGLGLVKRSDGILSFGNYNNRMWGTINLYQGGISFSDISGKPARSALRCNPVSFTSGSTMSYSGSNASDICMGSLSGSGEVDAGSNGIVSHLIWADASSDVTITTGANGFALYGYNSAYTQTLSGDIRSLDGLLTVYGRRKSSTTTTGNLRLWSNSSDGSASSGSASANLVGGRLFLDNSTANAGTGTGTDRFCSTCNINLAGGLLEMKGNSAGSVEDVKFITLGTGSSSIKIEHMGGAGGTEINSTSTTLFASNAVINFISGGGTLGSTGANPRLNFASLPTNTTSGMLAQTSGANAATIGWAVVNGNKWAGINGSNSIYGLSETSRDTSNLASVAQWEITNFTPYGYAYNLTSSISPAAFKITQNSNFSFDNDGAINTTAIMLDGNSTDATSINGTGTISNGTNPRYFWVNNATTMLTIGCVINDQNADIIKAGQGTLQMNSTLSFSALTNITLLEGTLRIASTQLNGTSSSGGAYTNINLFGGMLELNNVPTFSRAIGVNGTSGGGGLFMNAGTGGGFTTYNGTSTITLVTTIGGSTAATLRWESGGFLPDGAPLILNPTGGILNLANDIELDNGSPGPYKLREIYVGSSNYATVRHIYGSSTTDLIKTGPGELRMLEGHYFSGNFIIAEGSVRLINGNLFNTSTTLIVKSGGTLIMDAGVTFADIILEPGGTIQGPYGPVMNGNLVYNGGTMNCTSGGCYWSFVGTSQSCIDGQAINFGSKGWIYVNNSGGVIMNNNITADYLGFNAIATTLSIGSNTLTLSDFGGSLSPPARLKCNGSSNLVLNGSGALYTNLFFDQTTPGITNRLNNFTFNRTLSGSGTLANALQIAGTLTTGGNLTLISNASTTARAGVMSGTISGNVTVQRYIASSGRRWRYLSSPCSGRMLNDWKGEIHITGTGGATNGFDATLNNAPSVYLYDETVTTGTLDNGWTAATNITDAITVGKGYRVFVRGPRTDNGLLDGTNNTQNTVTLDVAGSLNTGNISMPVSYTSSGTSANDGWCLLGNPYASAYDWDGFYNLGNSQDDGAWYLNINPTVYVFNATTNAYSSYNAISQSGTLTSGIIPSGTAFFVKTNAGPVMTFTEDYKTTTTPASLHKTGKINEFTIKFFADSNESDEFVFKKINEATVLNDVYDIQKLQNPNINIGSHGIDNILLSLDCQPLAAAYKEVKLAVDATNTGAYNFRFTNLENFEPGVSVKLKDNFTSKLIDLRTAKQYNFDITADENSKGKNRFLLLFNHSVNSLETSDTEVSLAYVYPIPAKDKLYIQLAEKHNMATYWTIYDLSGTIIKTGICEEQTTSLNLSDLANGIYILGLNNRSSRLNFRIVK